MKLLAPLPLHRGWVMVIRLLFYGGFAGLGIIVFNALRMRPDTDGRQLQAKRLGAELELGIERFYDDFGKLPIVTQEDVTFSSNSEMGLDLLRVLMARETEDPINEKEIRYLSLKTSDPVQSHGLMIGSAGEVLDLRDPWGRSYMIALDGDGDGEITVQPKASKEPRKLQRRVAVWSKGKDADDPEDDVITW